MNQQVIEQAVVESGIRTVSIIGSGNVASWFAFACMRAGVVVQQIWGRTAQKCQNLAAYCHAEAITDLANLRRDSDLYIFSVKDDVYAEVVKQVPFSLPLAVLTAGSVSQGLLSPTARATGVLYPCQTLTQGVDFEKVAVPLCVEGSAEATTARLLAFAKQLTPMVYAVSEARRATLHLAAVFACNFSNALCATAFDILSQANIDRQLLMPLLQNMVEKLGSMSAWAAQTGPARRHDTRVMQQHLNALQDPDLQEIYKLISEYIMKMQNA